MVSVSFLGVKGETLLHALEDEGIYVSTGSACSSHSRNANSHVLKEIGLSGKEIGGTIRFSFNPYNTFEEADYAAEKLKNCLKFLRRIKI